MTPKKEEVIEEVEKTEKDTTEKKIDRPKREIVIPGEVIVSGKEYLPGEGTKRKGDDIIAGKYGLSDVSGRLVKIIPLSGTYKPRMGNIIIGRVTDVTFNGWLMDIGSPYSTFLSVSECPRFIKGDLTEYYNFGEMLVCKIASVKRKGIDLTIKGRGLGKLESGIIIKINSNKVPRVIGREGSMIRLIKENTNCNIVIGQNGIVWISGDKIEDELKAKEAILFIVNKSYIEGLTDRMQEFFKEKK